jgi:hypothetical protein
MENRIRGAGPGPSTVPPPSCGRLRRAPPRSLRFPRPGGHPIVETEEVSRCQKRRRRIRQSLSVGMTLPPSGASSGIETVGTKEFNPFPFPASGRKTSAWSSIEAPYGRAARSRGLRRHRPFRGPVPAPRVLSTPGRGIRMDPIVSSSPRGNVPRRDHPCPRRGRNEGCRPVDEGRVRRGSGIVHACGLDRGFRSPGIIVRRRLAGSCAGRAPGPGTPPGSGRPRPDLRHGIDP